MQFDNLEHDVLNFRNMGARVCSIGKTYLGRDIWCVIVGSGRPYILVQYAIHAREHITSYLALKQIAECVTKKFVGTIFFIPIANPDGVALCLDGLKSVREQKFRDELISINNAKDFSLWKANIRGVDLNVNFPALWGLGIQNTLTRGSANYIGEYAGSELETQHLMRFTEKIRPDSTVSYHCKGEVIYYQFYQQGANMDRDRIIAQELSQWTGYPIASMGLSTGGYKDWCIKKYHIPAFTIEVGSDALTHPISKRELPTIWVQNRFVVQNLLALLRYIYYN